MPNLRDAFPLGLAYGKNFCNRKNEQNQILHNLEMTRSTLVSSPRRYGKTSLVLNVLRHQKAPFVYVDLYAELDEVGMANSILSGIGGLLYKLESAPKKAFKLVSDFFSNINLSFSFKGADVKVHFSSARISLSKTLLDILKELDKLLQKKEKTAILFLDEFQRISEVSASTTFEGVFRHIAQQTQNISFIFSGSNRHLLEAMFNDRARPFYNLCDKLILQRIEAKHYTPFIQKRAKSKWGGALSDEVLEEIYAVTQRHPYYLNVLCSKLWYQETKPTVNYVHGIWERYAMEEKSRIMADLDNLSSNQSKLIRAIAKYGAEYLPTSKEFLSITKFSSSSVVQSLKRLKELDYVYLDEEQQYKILDPLVETLFS